MLLTSVVFAATLLQSGQKLQVTDLKVGKGETAQAEDVLVMDYTGKLMNGKMFDTSVGKKPFVFMLGAGEVIKGWDRGMLGMKVGGKRHLIIPADLAYGDRAMGADIPANSTLAFDVELKEILHDKIVTTKPGHGPGAKIGDTVQLNFIIKLASGKEIENTYTRKTPAKFPLSPAAFQQGLPRGIVKGILGMKVGEKRTVTIPPALGLGDRSTPSIPANSTLICQLEAVSIGK